MHECLSHKTTTKNGWHPCTKDPNKKRDGPPGPAQGQGSRHNRAGPLTILPVEGREQEAGILPEVLGNDGEPDGMLPEGGILGQLFHIVIPYLTPFLIALVVLIVTRDIGQISWESVNQGGDQYGRVVRLKFLGPGIFARI